ncbi:MAG: helix-turn-helix domain-containing protein [Clostridiales bacterium]|nr:helix-turn-helix domain-containing protein [Clostridiales bacterium]
MDYMVSTKKLERILEEMKEASKREYLLFSVDGKCLAGTVASDGFAEAVTQFAHSLAETQVQQGWIYFRVEIQGETEYVLLCSVGTEAGQSYVIGRMALCQIRNVFLSVREPENRINVLRQIINGEIPREKVAEKCHYLQLKPGRYVLYVVHYRQEADTILLEMLKNLCVNSYEDFMVEMDGTKTVLVKNVTDIPNEDFEQYARTIVDNMQAEAMTNVWVGYGDPVDAFEEMYPSYCQAKTALDIGLVYCGTERVFYYHHLGLGRLIYKLPPDQCELFLQEVLGENMELELDDETLTTINKLFDNNLNISETARQLYIHRNTLVYRLERIEKKLGLDIRSFEDAMLFKIAMMVRTHLNSL